MVLILPDVIIFQHWKTFLRVTTGTMITTNIMVQVNQISNFEVLPTSDFIF